MRASSGCQGDVSALQQMQLRHPARPSPGSLAARACHACLSLPAHLLAARHQLQPRQKQSQKPALHHTGLQTQHLHLHLQRLPQLQAQDQLPASSRGRHRSPKSKAVMPAPLAACELPQPSNAGWQRTGAARGHVSSRTLRANAGTVLKDHHLHVVCCSYPQDLHRLQKLADSITSMLCKSMSLTLHTRSVCCKILC